jgi:hypothetical protein
MANLYRLLCKQDTYLKQEPIQASALPSSRLQKIAAGTQLVLQSYTAPDTTKHYKISLSGLQFKGFSMNWYAFADHVSINSNPFLPIQTIETVIFNQTDKSVANIYIDQLPAPNQQGFLKLVFNVDTVIKRQPIASGNLNDDSKQNIPAGTELVLYTNQPDANRMIKFPIKDSHAKVTFKDVGFKGFSNDWYVFIKHAGIQRIIL